jgi:Domain of unknown function (DUF2019)
MTRVPLSEMTVEQLVERFAAITSEQDREVRIDNNAKFKRLFWQMEAVKDELKGREGDQRRALLRLYHHPLAQVRMKAAIATLALEPKAARRVLESIRDSHDFPQAGDAGMALVMLDRGIFKPS